MSHVVGSSNTASSMCTVAVGHTAPQGKSPFFLPLLSFGMVPSPHHICTKVSIIFWMGPTVPLAGASEAATWHRGGTVIEMA